MVAVLQVPQRQAEQAARFRAALQARAVAVAGPARSGAAAPVARRQRRGQSEPVKAQAAVVVAPRPAREAPARRGLSGWFTSLRGKRRAFLCTVAKSIVKNVPAR